MSWFALVHAGAPQSLDQISSLLCFCECVCFHKFSKLLSFCFERETHQTSPPLLHASLLWHISCSRKETSEREASGKAWCCHVCPTSTLISSRFWLLFLPFRGSLCTATSSEGLPRSCPRAAGVMVRKAALPLLLCPQAELLLE